MWDSWWNSGGSWAWVVTFNSLCEIPGDLRLWSDLCCILSILYVRFSMEHTGIDLIQLILSILYVRFPRSGYYVGWRYSTLSILYVRFIEKYYWYPRRIASFQFSMWDSKRLLTLLVSSQISLSILYVRFYDPSKATPDEFILSILYVRFEKAKEVLQKIKRIFQFSMWDSA